MSNTRHIQKRISQRGIAQELLGIVEQFGELSSNGEKITLNRKGVLKTIEALNRLRGQLLSVLKKDGLVVVAAGGDRITAYRLNSFDSSKKAANDSQFESHIPQ